MSRIRKAALALTGMVAVTLCLWEFGGRQRAARWGMTDRELQSHWPGDALVRNGRAGANHAITIDAPAAAIWPWISQIGQNRAGFYSYSWLEDLAGADIHNTYRIVAAWQSRRAGDDVWLAPPGRFGSLPHMKVAILDPERAMVLVPAVDYPTVARDGAGASFIWCFLLAPIDAGTTRLICRQVAASSDPGLWQRAVGYLFWEAAHFLMERKMMLTVKSLAERGRP
jgi:hypothetical protein